MPKVAKSQLIELILTGQAGGNNSAKLQFNDQPYLRNKQILGIEVLNSNDVTKSPSNRTPINLVQMQGSFLTLYLNDPGDPSKVGEWIQDVPLPLLHRVQNAQNDVFARQMFDLVGQVIYWEKCYITIPTPFANTTDISFLIQVYFKG